MDNENNKAVQAEEKTIINIEKPEPNFDFAGNIEKERQNMFNMYQKNRKISSLLMVIVLVGAIGSFILVMNEDTTLKIIGYVLIGLLFVGMLVYHFLTRNNLPDATKKYASFVTTAINQNIYADEKFTNCHFNIKEKLELGELVSDGIYENVCQIASRNVVRGNYENGEFTCSEVALYVKGEKNRNQTCFLGKYLSFPNNLHFENRFVLSYKTEKAIDLPTGLSDLVILFENDKYAIYGKEGSDYSAAFSKELVDQITNSIELDEHLLNLSVVLWASHSACYFSYDDSVMALPFDKPFNTDANDKFKKDLNGIAEAFASINK